MTETQRSNMIEALEAEEIQTAVIVDYTEGQLTALNILGVAKSDREDYAVKVVASALKNAVQGKINTAVLQMYKAQGKGNTGDVNKLNGSIKALEEILRTL